METVDDMILEHTMKFMDKAKKDGKTYKVHMDGCDQKDMLTRGGKSACNDFWYFPDWN